MGEERNVGMINYELGIRGKQLMDSATRKMVLNRPSNLIAMAEPGKFKEYRKESQEIQRLAVQWNSSVETMAKEGYSEKDILNTKKENMNLKDLEFLKSQKPPGPFTKKSEVEEYMQIDKNYQVRTIDCTLKCDMLVPQAVFLNKTPVSCV